MRGGRTTTTSASQRQHDEWSVGDAYESYMGRWSEQLAPRFLGWLGVPPGRRWLDIGCGTGALSAAILESCRPSAVVGVEPSEGFRAAAVARLRDPRFTVVAGAASDLAPAAPLFDAVVSSLVLNFVPDEQAAARSMFDAASPSGVAAACVWDYAEGLGFVRLFWDAATELDERAAQLDEGRRFPICAPAPLRDLFAQAGFADVEVARITIPTVFDSVDDLWKPFTLGQGPAPGYASSLGADELEQLRQAVMNRTEPEADGRVVLQASAWAVRGTRSV
jgi:SAM-dependent methyltransferase